MALISGHPAIRVGLARVIGREPGLRADGYDSRSAAAASFLATRPDVVLVDAPLAGDDAFECCHALKQLVVNPRVALYCDRGDDVRVAAWIARADALIDKRLPVAELFEELRLVAGGRRRVGRPTPTQVASALGETNPAERAVLGMCLHGVDVPDISRALRCDPLEVERIVRRLVRTSQGGVGSAAARP